VEGWALSKTHSFLCFQSIQGIRSVVEARPLCMGFVVASLLDMDHSSSDEVPSGGWQGSRSQAKVSYQIWHEKGQAVSK
jgi:hypothetical protein